MANINGPVRFKYSKPDYNKKKKDYNYLILVDVYDLTFEEAKLVTKMAKSGDKNARKMFKKSR